ncbi:hypothetical protein [Pedobacter sp. L105]|uniref:YobI family P-loop NTPase n=1 Tax=Pedobacter sp. L105 TaxID=1641871 RepID=UPI00131CF417|nr:hypothetical protein [Pedobacter sp. L105]
MNHPSNEHAIPKPKIHPARPSNIRRRLKIFRAGINREYRSAQATITAVPQKLRNSTSKRFIKAIIFLDSKITGFAFNPNTSSYRDLAPIEDADQNKLYTNMLLWGIKNPNVSNIAITGPYGSGKSSIIRTFQKRHLEFRSVNLSLASFDEEKDDKGEWRNKVELSVLQQLIYHERSHDLPDSRFVKIRPIRWYSRLFGTLLLSIFALSYFYVTQGDYFKRFKFITEEVKPFLDLGFLTLLVLGSIYLLYRLYRNIRNLRFTKLSVVTAGAEFSEGETRSIFNKHLDEIIYFFEETNTSLIIIEDLDRFNDTEIFTKLREINILINNSRQINHKVNFIYAVRDNIFTQNNRTKFFDLLIPVIPIISVANAGDALAVRLDTIIPNRKMPRELLRTVTLYIQDMRMLLNIVNEFSLYYATLSKDLDPEKLLSLIIFKNLHPGDFAKLHHGKGMIIRVLDKKKLYVGAQKESIDQQINSLQSHIRELEALKIKDIEELRSLYVYKAIAALPAQANLTFNGETRPSEFIKETAFDWWRNGGALIANGFNRNYGSYQPISFSYPFSTAEKEVDQNQTYLQRLENIETYTKDGISKAKLKIETLGHERALLSRQSLKEILDNGGQFDFPTEKPTSSILIYLMSNGYIDEYYHPYISYFIEGSLKQEDMNFVMSILNRQPLAYNYSLANIDVIVRDWISIGQYSNTAVLNFNLLSWLLEQPDRNQEISLLINMLKTNQDVSFIDAFLGEQKNQDTFIPALVANWPEIWDYLFEESFYDDSTMAVYAALFIRHLSTDILEKSINATSKFSGFLSYNTDVYNTNLLTDKQEALARVLSDLKVSFLKVDVLEMLPKTLEAVYEQHLYQLTGDNLRYIMVKFGGQDPFPETEWDNANFSTILASDARFLKTNLEKEMPVYLELISKNEKNTKENAETLVKLLNTTGLDQEKTKAFVKKQTTILPDLEAVPEEYREFLISGRQVTPSWKNVSTYFLQQQSLDETLTSYLNDPKVYSNLVLESYPARTQTTETETLDLSQEVLYRIELSIESYKALLDHLSPSMEGLDVEQLDEEKVRYLIDSDRIIFDNEMFSDLQTHYPGVMQQYLVKYFDNFLEAFNELSIADKTLLDVLASFVLSDAQKANLIEHILTHQQPGQNALGTAVISFLLQYPSWPETVQQSNVIPLLKLPFSTSERIKILTPIISEIGMETYKEIETTLDEPFNHLSINDTSQRSFPKFAGTHTFIELIKVRLPGILGTIKENNDNITVYYKGV